MKYKIGDKVKLNMTPIGLQDVKEFESNGRIVTIVDLDKYYFTFMDHGESYVFEDDNIDKRVFEGLNFKEGDKVTIVDNFDAYWMVPDMKKYLGKSAVIINIDQRGSKINYKLNIDNNTYFWRNIDFKEYYNIADHDTSNNLLTKIYSALGV